MPVHEEHRELPYGADQMFDLVADVARYPEFLPWTAAARIRSRRPFTGGEVMDADLVISFKVFRERFGSRVTMWHADRTIQTEYIDGPFRYMKSQWRFTPKDSGGCKVDFQVDFEFRNAILQRLIGVVFNEAMQRIVRAFETRAEELYGGGARRHAGG
ncbi:MAG: type II toxin-antitoxin system RatA family toxin [Alkalilacustris sp.]